MGKSKIVPINKHSRHNELSVADNYNFAEKVKEFDKYFNSDKDQHKIFTELGFSFCEDEEICFACDRNGSCPEHPGNAGMYVNGRLNFAAKPSLKKIRIVVDVLEIMDAMESYHSEFENQSYLDIETGTVAFVSQEVMNIIESDATQSVPEWQQDELKIAQEVFADENRFLPIPKIDSSISFRFMEDFIETVPDERVADRLAASLQKNRPFRRFKDTLAECPELLDLWYTFKDKKLRSEVEIFLGSINHEQIDLCLPD